MTKETNRTYLIAEDYVPREIDMIGFSRTVFRRWMHVLQNGEIIHSLDLGLIDQEEYEKLIRAKATSSSSIKQPRDELSYPNVLEEVSRIIGNM